MNGVATLAQFGAGGRDHPTQKSCAARHPDRDVTDQTIEERDAIVLEVPPFGQDAFCSQVDRFTEGGRRHALRAPIEQLRPEVRFELMNALAQAGLRNVQHLGRLAQAAAFHRRDEPLQLT
jgi:hypothetical protein